MILPYGPFSAKEVRFGVEGGEFLPTQVFDVHFCGGGAGDDASCGAPGQSLWLRCMLAAMVTQVRVSGGAQ